MRQIFLSHNSVDAAAAKRLRDELLVERPSDKVFLSSEHGAGPVGGTNWQAWIRNVVTNCDVVVFIASKGSLSTWCSAELGMAQLLDKPIVPLHVGSTVDVNPLIAHIQAAPLDQPIEAILGLIDNRVGRPVTGIELEPEFIPYPGLEPLGEHQAGLLFGREADVRRILRDFSLEGQPRLVVISGPSGSGKSSLVRAGVAPALRAKGWSIAGPVQPQQVADEGQLEIGVDRPHLLIVDQAEELALLENEQREMIEAWLQRNLVQGVWVLMVVRSEFRAEVGLDLPKPIDHYVPFPGRDELYDIVRGPAKLANLGIRESLVDRLVGETGSGEALPLLALTLHELWKQRDTLNNELTEVTLNELGGVHGVLENLATEALDGAMRSPIEPVPMVDDVLATLTQLATPNRIPPTRSPIRAATLSEQQRRWLDEFARVGLVVYRTSYALDDRLGTGLAPTGDDLVDISHEALLSWMPLAQAIERERERNIERQSIERSGRDWDAGDRRDTSLLLSGDRLDFAQAEQLGTNDPVLRAFVAASIKNDRDRRLRRWLIAGLAVASVLAVVAAGLAFAQSRAASTERDTARAAETVAQSLRIASQSSAALSDERDFAMLAAVAAYQRAPNVDTEGALLAALNEPEGPKYFFSDEGANWSTLSLLDEDRGLVAGIDRRANVVTFANGGLERLGLGTELDNIRISEIRRIPHSTSVVFYGQHDDGGDVAGVYDFTTPTTVVHSGSITSVVADENWLVFGDVEGDVWVADLANGPPGQPQQIDTHQGRIIDIDISRDGRHLAATSAFGIRLMTAANDSWGPARDLFSVSAGAANLGSVAFRRDSDLGDDNELYAAGSDPTITRWTIDENGAGEPEAIGSHIGGVFDLVADPETAILVSAGLGGNLQRWNTAAGAELGRPLEAHRLNVRSLSTVGGTNRSYPLVSTDEDTAIVWDLAPARVTERPDVVPETWKNESIASLVLGDGPLAVVTNDERMLVDDGRELPAPVGVTRAWWLGDGLVFERQNLLTDPYDVTVWSMVDGELEQLAEGPGAVDVSSCLIAMADSTVVRFSNLGGCGSVPAPLALDHGADQSENTGVHVVVFSPNEQQLAVFYRDNFVEVYELANGDLTATMETNSSTVPTGAAWVDDRRLVVGHDVGSATELIDLDVPDETVSLDLHDDAVRWLVVDDAGDRLFTGGEDSDIRQTSLENQGQVVATFRSRRSEQENEEEAKVRGLHYHQEQSVLIALQNSQVVAWELDPDRLVSLACHRAGREPRAGERRKLGLEPGEVLC